MIAILAAISVVAYDGMRTRAEAAEAANTIKSAAKGLRLLAIEEGRSTYWLDVSFTGSGQPTLEEMSETIELSKYVASYKMPDVRDIIYDNDDDNIAHDGCSVSHLGVKLIATGVEQGFAQQIDDTLDDGNLSCGKVAYNSGNQYLSYWIARESKL